MRLAFWHRDEAVDVEAAAKPVRAATAKPAVPTPIALAGDIDLRALGEAIARKRRWIILPTLLAFALSVVSVNLVTPRYKSEVRILIDGRENVFLRPNGERNEERPTVDAEAVSSQVQLVL